MSESSELGRRLEERVAEYFRISGWRSGADRTAVDLGIDLWGPDELRRHLGDSAAGELSVPTGPTSEVVEASSVSRSGTDLRPEAFGVGRQSPKGVMT